ncbi:MAG: hypothetical protein H0T46_14565 [Deltaproteobacteria bacterium]|nr:hypothetical protein [Deltaproteobacteria bacterium]
MRTRTVLVVVALVVGCGKSSDEQPAKKEAPPETANKAEPPPAPPPKAEFPKHRWVRTEMFGSKKPYIGFTYIDKTKGPSIKGEDISGLTPAQIKEKLHAKFPSSTMQPLDEGHPITPLTDAEIKQLELPAEPEWASFYK